MFSRLLAICWCQKFGTASPFSCARPRFPTQEFGADYVSKAWLRNYGLWITPDNFAIFTAIRRASSLLSNLAADIADRVYLMSAT
jgi:hypothetical protein